MTHAWDDYWSLFPRVSCTTIEERPLSQPPGFIRLKERVRVKAIKTPVNSQDRRCRIRKVKLK